MAKKDIIDITKTGPQGFRVLQDLNSLESPNIRPEIRNFIQKKNAERQSYTLFNPYEQAPQDVESSLANTTTPWGSSIFDEKTTTEEQFSRLSDVRAENQPWYSKITAGLAKGAIYTGTTFLDGTIGLLLGTVQGIQNLSDDDSNTGFLSGLWDNDFSKTMKAINDWSEETLPNYYTQQETEGPWYENVFSANFLGDKFIKNLGFTIGAFASGNVAAGTTGLIKKGILKGAKALGASINAIKTTAKVSDFVATATGAVTSAVNEGRIEALNNSTDWFENQKLELDNSHNIMLEAIKSNFEGTEMYDTLIANENNVYNETLAKLTEDRIKMGNADLLMNIPILTFSNIVQFGKLYARGFKTAKKANNIIKNSDNYASTMSTTKGVLKSATMPLPEGLEEVSQKIASITSGLYYQDDVNNFHKKLIDPEAEEEQLDWIKSLALGINQTVNEGSTWEEFLLGTLTGALGMPMFRSSRNSEGKWQSPIYLQGGIRGKYKDYMKQMEKENELVSYMNTRIQSPEFINYYRGLIRHKAYQNDMNKAVIENNEFDFKNSEYNQLVSDIIMFDNAGKIEDLKTMIEEAFNTSNENLDSIIKNTTSKNANGNLIGPYAEYATIDSNGSIISNLINEDSKKKMILSLEKDKNEVLDTIKKYEDAKTELNVLVGDKLNDEQVKELIWLKVATDNLDSRTEILHEEIKPVLNKVIKYWYDSLNGKGGIRELRLKEGTKSSIVDGEKVFNVTKDYEDLTKSEKIIQSNIDFFGDIINGNPKIISMYFTDNKSLNKIIKAIEEVPSVTATEVQEFTKKSKDLAKIFKLSGEYSKKLNEYLTNPSKKVEDNIKAEKEVSKTREKKAQSTIVSRINWNGNTSSISESLEENMNDIESSGGIEKFLESLNDEQKAKAKKALSLTSGIKKLSNLIENSDLSDNQKRIAHSLVDASAKEADNMKSLGDKIQEKIENEISDKIIKEFSERENNLGELDKESIIYNTEYKLKEFFEEHISNIAKSITEAELAREVLEKKKADKIKQQADYIKDKEEPKSFPEEEGENEPEVFEYMDNTLEPSPTTTLPKKDMREYNPKTATPIRPPKGEEQKYTHRPQISEVYFHGYNMETYYDFITAHPEAIPEGVDIDEYKTYIKEVHTYLKNNGAFTFVNGTDSSWKMEIGDTIIFEYNKELSEKAGTPVVVMIVEKQDKRQVVGTLPTYLDFNGKSKYVKLDNNGKPLTDENDNWIWETSNKTVGEIRIAQKELYDNVINSYITDEVSEKDGIVTTKFTEHGKSKDGTIEAITIGGMSVPLNFIEEYIADNYTDTFDIENIETIKVVELKIGQGRQAGTILIKYKYTPYYSRYEVGFKKMPRLTIPTIKTKVSKLMGGKIIFSSNQNTLSEIFGEETPVIAVINESTTLSTGVKTLDEKLISPVNSIPWQIYAMVPANNGKYLPALCTSMPLSQLEDNDWYMQQIVEAIKQIPTNIVNLKDNTQKVFKWFNIKGLSIRIGRHKGRGGWENETADISRATHIRFSYTNPNDPEGVARFAYIPIVEGKVNDDKVLEVVKHIISRRNHDAALIGEGELTTNVDYKRLTNKPEDLEYRKNISRYLYTNIDKNSPHTRNDWFLYQPTEIEKNIEKGNKSKDTKRKIDLGKTEHGGTKIVIKDGNEYEINPNGEIRTVDGVEVSLGEEIDMGTPSETITVSSTEVSNEEVSFGSAITKFGNNSSSKRIAGKKSRFSRKGADMSITEENSKEKMSTADSIQNDIARIKKMFPSLNEEGRIVVVNGLRKITETGNSEEIYGHFRNGILYINSKSPRGTAFHEAFHYITNTLLTDKELLSLYNEASKIYNTTNEMELEEKLSEDFRYFMNDFDDSTLLGKIKSIFRNLKYIIKQLTGNITYLDNLFYNIYKNNISNRTEVIEDNFSVDILKYKNNKVAYEHLSKDIKKSLENRGITREDYNNLTTEDKERTLFCLY